MINFSDIANKLIDLHSVFYTFWSIGRPVASTVVPTAAVSLDSCGRVLLLYNEEYLEGCSADQRAFVFAHEMLHIIHRHLERVVKLKNKVIANLAADLVVNESLVRNFGMDRAACDRDYVWLDKAFPNDPDVPYGHSMESYYSMLEKEWAEEAQLPFSSPDEHILEENLCDKIRRAIEERLSSSEIASFNRAAGVGLSCSETLLNPTKVKVRASWKSVLLRDMLGVRRSREVEVERWDRKSRRNSLLQSNVLSPGILEDSNPKFRRHRVSLFLDVSGSCHHLSKEFFDAYKSIPKSVFDIALHTFDTEVSVVPRGASSVRSGGGTSFECIESFLRGEDRYPDHVFVITDGYGDAFSVAHPNRWHFFLSKDGTDKFIPMGATYYNLDDFTHAK